MSAIEEKIGMMEAELEVLTVLETFDKDRLAIVIDRVLVYSEERIEIIWKMDDWFFKEIGVKKKCLRCSNV